MSQLPDKTFKTSDSDDEIQINETMAEVIAEFRENLTHEDFMNPQLRKTLSENVFLQSCESPNPNLSRLASNTVCAIAVAPTICLSGDTLGDALLKSRTFPFNFDGLVALLQEFDIYNVAAIFNENEIFFGSFIREATENAVFITLYDSRRPTEVTIFSVKPDKTTKINLHVSNDEVTPASTLWNDEEKERREHADPVALYLLWYILTLSHGQEQTPSDPDSQAPSDE